MAGMRQLTPQLNARHVLQMNIQHEAGGLTQVRALEKAFNAVEDLGLKSMDLQHSLHGPEHTRVIVYNDDEIARALGCRSHSQSSQRTGELGGEAVHGIETPVASAVDLAGTSDQSYCP
jgi:hypothetical protein